MERTGGIGPPSSGWNPEILPLYEARIYLVYHVFSICQEGLRGDAHINGLLQA